MNTVILNPADPTQAIIGSFSEPVFGANVKGHGVIGNIHLASKCQADVIEGHVTKRACVIHSPTDHHMREWDLHWRDDRGIFERICPTHGTGHPDPDQFEYWDMTDQQWQAVHGCCGCCRA